MTDQLPQVEVMPVQGTGTPTVTPTPRTPAKKFSPLLLVVIIAILISTGGAAFIWFQPKASSPAPQVLIEASPVPSVKSLTLDLISPADGEVTVNGEVLVKGRTIPGVTVAIFTETDEETVESDSTGNFETTMTLTDGINSLTIIALSDDGQEKSVTRDIVYDAEG